jgi:hypothetical protein
MRKIALSLFVGFTGCAAFNGQYPVAHSRTIELKQRLMPTARVAGGSEAGDAPAYGVFTIENGTDELFIATIECVDDTEHRLTVAPYTAQQVLVTTTISESNKQLCVVHQTELISAKL